MKLFQSDLVAIVAGTNLSPGQLILGVRPSSVGSSSGIVYFLASNSCFTVFICLFICASFLNLIPQVQQEKVLQSFSGCFWWMWLTISSFGYFSLQILHLDQAIGSYFALFSRYSWIFMVCCCKTAVVMVVLWCNSFLSYVTLCVLCNVTVEMLHHWCCWNMLLDV